MCLDPYGKGTSHITCTNHKATKETKELIIDEYIDESDQRILESSESKIEATNETLS